MTPAQKAQQAAYNEFIADYVERHGECKATRDEAHEVAGWIETMAKEVSALCFKYAGLRGIAEDAANDLCAAFVDDNANHGISCKDEAKFLAACAIASALEVGENV